LRARAGGAPRGEDRPDARAAGAVRRLLPEVRRPHGVHRAVHHRPARLWRGARGRQRTALADVLDVQRRRRDRLVDGHRDCALRAALGGAGIGIADVRAIVLTHIHLDHAGATGTLARENPALRVYVHERGAPHMINPEKLIASASRLWPGEIDRLWGAFLPVP